jgi:hypothetical protein
MVSELDTVLTNAMINTPWLFTAAEYSAVNGTDYERLVPESSPDVQKTCGSCSVSGVRVSNWCLCFACGFHDRIPIGSA